MKHRLRQRLWAKDGDPGPLAWSIASISLVLPILGLILCLLGAGRIFRDVPGGWTLAGIGVAVLVLDILIDFVWAHPGISASDQPTLNRRADQLAGRLAIVAEAIEGGRGKVRVGDTVWTAEGPDLPAGSSVRIATAKANVLVVERGPTEAA